MNYKTGSWVTLKLRVCKQRLGDTISEQPSGYTLKGYNYQLVLVLGIGCILNEQFYTEYVKNNIGRSYVACTIDKQRAG